MEYDTNESRYNTDSVQPPPQNYQQPAHGEYYNGAYPPPQDKNPLGIVSMVLGIVSLLFTLLTSCCAPGANMPFAIAAIITGIFQLRSKTNQNGRGMGMAGVICGAISAVIFLLILLGYLTLFIIGLFYESETGSYNY